MSNKTKSQKLANWRRDILTSLGKLQKLEEVDSPTYLQKKQIANIKGRIEFVTRKVAALGGSASA